jgi:hypothetical protein
MKRDFDYYEFAAIILPGFIVLLFAAFVLPQTRTLLLNGKLGVGDFGVLVLLSYICGHLVQAISNLWEAPFWKLQHGMPTNWIVLKGQKLLSESQIKLMPQAIRGRLKGFPDNLEEIPIHKWRGAPSQMCAVVRSEGRAARLDTFNGNYGLLRGIVSAMLTIAIATVLVPVHPIGKILGWEALIAALALYRMQRFAVYYAKELFVQFIQLPGGLG